MCFGLKFLPVLPFSVASITGLGDTWILRSVVGTYLEFNNSERRRQEMNRQTPDQVNWGSVE